MNYFLFVLDKSMSVNIYSLTSEQWELHIYSK